MSRRPVYKPRKCEVCGANFTPTAAHAKVCSAECRAELTRRLQREAYHLTHPAPNAWRRVRCRVCGKVFCERVRATFDDCTAHTACRRCRTLMANGTPYEELRYPDWKDPWTEAGRRMKAYRNAKKISADAGTAALAAENEKQTNNRKDRQ